MMDLPGIQSIGLVFFRVAAMVALIPALGGLITIRLRIAIALGLTILVAPLLIGQVPLTISGERWWESALEQVFCGAMIGGAVRIWVGSLAMTGGWISQLAGWGVEMAPIDGGESSAPLGQLYGWLGGLAFLAIDGPNMAIRALLDSFAGVPSAMAGHSSKALAEFAVAVLHQSFWLALQIGSPVMTSLLAASIGVAAIQRAMPNVNLARFQLAGNWLVLLVALSLTIGLNVDCWSQRVAGLMKRFPKQWAAAADVDNPSAASTTGLSRPSHDRGE